MVTFKKIRWKNILSTGNVFTEVGLTPDGTTLIVGQNGAGKSTILDVLTFVLFGRTFRSINKPQLVNSINRKDAVAEIEFVSGSKQYKIIRGIKPTIFEIYCNDVLMNQSADSRDYQEILEKQILRINYKSFCQVVILGSASFVPFMQLPAAQRRTIIEDLLDLDIFTTMNVLLKDKIQINQTACTDNDHIRKMIEQRIELVQKHLNDIKTKSDKFVKEKCDTIKKLNQDIQTKTESINSTIIQIEQYESQIENITTIQQRLDKLKTLRVQIESRSQQLKKELEFFSKHDSCPTCKQAIDQQFKCDTMESRSSQIQEIENGLSKLVETYDEVNNKLSEVFDVQKTMTDLKSSLYIMTTERTHWEKSVVDLQKEILSAKSTTKSDSDSAMKDLEREQTEVVIKFNELQEERQMLGVAAMLLKDGGIKTKIINQYIPVINKLINKYLAEFDLFCEFQLDEQFNETIKSRYRDTFSYSSFSEGEKQKIDLAILFAWRAIAKLRNSLNTNLLILDEVFDSSLDGNAADDLLKILSNISNDSNVFIISHREQLFEKFDNTIKFIKHKSFSTIENQNV